MTPNTMRATKSRIIRRRIPTRIPARQAASLHSVSHYLTTPSFIFTHRTNGQFQITPSRTPLNLTPSPRLPRTPQYTLTRPIRRSNLQRSPREPVAKEVRHVIPDGVAVEVVCEDGLAGIGLKDAVLNGAEFDRDAAGLGIGVEGLAVGRLNRRRTRGRRESRIGLL
jgi:hypothetical protein